MTAWRASRIPGVVALVVLFVAVTFSAPYWSELLRRSPEGPVEEPQEPPAAAPSAAATPAQTPARFFFAAAGGPGLVVEERFLPFSTDLSKQVRAVADAVVAGPSGPPLRATFPPGAKVLDAFVTPQSIAIINLSKEATVGGRGTDGELVAVYSLVNSVISTFPSLRRVQILVESQPALTLGGHVDLSRPLAADTTLLNMNSAPEPNPATPQ